MTEVKTVLRVDFEGVEVANAKLESLERAAYQAAAAIERLTEAMTKFRDEGHGDLEVEVISDLTGSTEIADRLEESEND